MTTQALLGSSTHCAAASPAGEHRGHPGGACRTGTPICNRCPVGIVLGQDQLCFPSTRESRGGCEKQRRVSAALGPLSSSSLTITLKPTLHTAPRPWPDPRPFPSYFPFFPSSCCPSGSPACFLFPKNQPKPPQKPAPPVPKRHGAARLRPPAAADVGVATEWVGLGASADWSQAESSAPGGGALPLDQSAAARGVGQPYLRAGQRWWRVERGAAGGE